MKKSLLTLFLFIGISTFKFVHASTNLVSVVTFTTSQTSGNFTTFYEYSFIDSNGNGCLDPWETCVFMRSYVIESLGNSRYLFHEN